MKRERSFAAVTALLLCGALALAEPAGSPRSRSGHSGGASPFDGTSCFVASNVLYCPTGKFDAADAGVLNVVGVARIGGTLTLGAPALGDGVMFANESELQWPEVKCAEVGTTLVCTTGAGGLVITSGSSEALRFSGTDDRGPIWANGGYFRMVSATGMIQSTNVGIAIGSGGTGIATSFATAVALDFPSALINTCDDLTITVTGTAGAPVSLGIPNTAVTAGSVYVAWMSATNTCTVRHCCNEGASCNPDSATFTCRAWNP